MLDIHCHILPGIDHGSSCLEESIAMLDAARAAGIDRIAGTPHCLERDFDVDEVRAAVELLRPHAEQRGIRLLGGAEVHWKALAERGLDSAHELCIGGSPYLLLEFSTQSLPVSWESALRALVADGIVPVIAHPERYAPIRANVSKALQMRAIGCKLQLSANFVAPSKSKSRLACARKLFELGAVDFVASDAHCVEDYANFAEARALMLREHLALAQPR